MKLVGSLYGYCVLALRGAAKAELLMYIPCGSRPASVRTFAGFLSAANKIH